MSYQGSAGEKAAKILIPGLSVSVMFIKIVSEEGCECRSPKALGQVLSGYVTESFLRILKSPQMLGLFKGERKTEIECL